MTELIKKLISVVAIDDVMTDSNTHDGPGDEFGIPTSDESGQSLPHNRQGAVHLEENVLGFDV